MTDMCKKGKQCDRYKQVNTSASPCLPILDIITPELNFETHKNLLKQNVDFEKFELGKFFKTHKIR